MSESEFSTQPSAQERRDYWDFFAELIRTAIIVTVLAYVIRLFVIQPFVVEGSSMYPLFHNNDYLVVEKVSYAFGQPQRGDVIVFKYPRNTAVNYVKRIIGLPGEKVEIKDGKVTIVNSAHPSGITLSEPYVNNGDPTLSMPSANGGNTAMVSDFTVPVDDYFVMGDNRQASSDSREWGFLPKEDIIGRVIVQAFPLDRFGIISHARYGE
jgi:signal peptidase I